MSGDFRFDDGKSFDENFSSLLDALKNNDQEMAAILRANAPALEAIVRDGERDSNARAAFNATIADALEALAAPKPETG